ncbi:MAG: uracil-DNA glycosylase [Methylococcaceae bacterium]|nr:uracil-DNA glycosylase [Methylococcaceae bacterium]
MDNTTRLQYLEAMGIDSWMPKTQAANPIDAVTEVITPVVEAESQANIVSQAVINPVVESPEIMEVKDNWETLERELKGCQKCELAKTRTQTILGVGNKNAEWLFIGEDPDEHEDSQGEPFVDNIGLLFTEMLRSLGLKREQVFMTNILKCRPPDDRAVKAGELSGCHDYLMRQKALLKPKIMVAVGRVAAQQLLKTSQPLKELRGVVHQVDNTPLVVVYHPAYLLRSLTKKRAAWQDLQFALKTYQHL